MSASSAMKMVIAPLPAPALDPPTVRSTYTIDTAPLGSPLRPLGAYVSADGARRLCLDDLGLTSFSPAGRLPPPVVPGRPHGPAHPTQLHVRPDDPRPHADPAPRPGPSRAGGGRRRPDRRRLRPQGPLVPGARRARRGRRRHARLPGAGPYPPPLHLPPSRHPPAGPDHLPSDQSADPAPSERWTQEWPDGRCTAPVRHLIIVRCRRPCPYRPGPQRHRQLGPACSASCVASCGCWPPVARPRPLRRARRRCSRLRRLRRGRRAPAHQQQR